jgi:hypothetical protein
MDDRAHVCSQRYPLQVLLASGPTSALKRVPDLVMECNLASPEDRDDDDRKHLLRIVFDLNSNPEGEYHLGGDRYAVSLARHGSRGALPESCSQGLPSARRNSGYPWQLPSRIYNYIPRAPSGSEASLLTCRHSFPLLQLFNWVSRLLDRQFPMSTRNWGRWTMGIYDF